ncbi:hypothetical protein JOD54_004174 [Actinokineospora baliensis]|uniref:hypothetical protein n=1 Tax=Actinokineospora baliensis TaxID=547056 RepID=UPI00195614C1|nr:hypothetical protein [Actinokineospora baliensis]MBM7773970.1 hypothetical protein [Actinokineospora baliensis]
MLINPSDSDFRVAQIEFSTLLEIQLEAERHGWATRWTSVGALRDQVKDDAVLLRTWKRELRDGVVRTYRCLVLFSGPGGAGGLVAVDLSPARCESLVRLDRDPDVRSAFVRVFALALGGMSMASKT